MDNPPPYSPPGVQPPPPLPPQAGFAVQQGFSGGQPVYVQQPAYVQHTTQVHYQPPPASETIIVTSSPVLLGAFGPNPQCITCPHCNNTLVTRVNTEPTTKTHLVAFVMCLFMCWPCCLLPYCMDSCQSRNHYCYHCGAFLGSYN